MTALDKSTRRKIFYGMILLFAGIVPLALLYSRGYIVDVRRRGLVATGGIFVKTVQPGTKVYIDAEFSKETAFISHGALITNLLPRRYTVRVEKDGYRPWQKVVRVSNEEVLEFRDIFLPPATVTPAFVFNLRRQLPTRLGLIAGRPEVGVALGDPTGPYTVFAVDPATHLAPVNLVKVSRWFWDERAKAYFIGRRDGESRMRWYRLSMSGSSPGKEELISFRGLPQDFSADSVFPNPDATNELYFLAGGALFLQGKSSVPLPIAEQVHAYTVTPDHIYFMTKNGFFVGSNLNGGEAKILGRKGLFLSDDFPATLMPLPEGNVAVLDSAGGLFVYRPERDAELTFVGGNVMGFDTSGRGDRMLFWEANRIWVYWLRDNRRQPFDLAGSKRQVFYSNTPLQQAFLNTAGSHVYFSTSDRIQMVEVDDRAGVNAYDLVTAPISSFALDKNAMTLYWVEGQAMFRAGVE